VKVEQATGTVVAIHIASSAEAPMASLQEAHAVADKGLEGDRYFDAQGTYSDVPEPGRQVTLIEMEAIEAASRDAGIEFLSSDSRRNIMTRNVRLNDLVGRDFCVGGVTLRGVELCEPCAHMVALSGKRVLRSLVHRGGLRAEILGGGTIRVGDTVKAR
jgi:MOSC domain-containing protein YiiM